MTKDEKLRAAYEQWERAPPGKWAVRAYRPLEAMAKKLGFRGDAVALILWARERLSPAPVRYDMQDG